MYVVYLCLFVFLLLNNLSAQFYESKTGKLNWTPHLQFGTHTSGLGLDSKISQDINLQILSISGDAFGSLDQYTSYLNVPGAATVFSYGGGVAIGIGAIVNGPVPWSGHCTSRKHQIWYDYKAYIDNRGTSQPSGRIGYLYRCNTFSIGASFENDIFAFNGKDRFRTGALEIASAFRNPFVPLNNGLSDFPLRISAGVKVWTGDGSTSKSSPNVPVLFRSPGPYPTGIVYGGFAFGPAGIEIGWDSDHIRDFFQNNLHRLLKNQTFSIRNEDKGRLYFRFTLFSNGDLY
jgi:hypothetical protein